MINSYVWRVFQIWMPNNAESICRKLGEKLRQPTLHVFIRHCGTESARSAPLITLTDSHTHTLSFCGKPNFISILRRGRPNANHILLLYRKYRLNALVGSVRYLNFLLEYTLFYYLLELYPRESPCWIIPNPNTLLRYILSFYIAKRFPISIHCWVIPNAETLFSFGQLYYIAIVNRISLHSRATPNPNTLLRYSQHY